MDRERSEGQPCTGCGQETACAYYDGDRKVQLFPERMRRDPGAREILLVEGPARPN